MLKREGRAACGVRAVPLGPLRRYCTWYSTGIHIHTAVSYTGGPDTQTDRSQTAPSLDGLAYWSPLGLLRARGDSTLNTDGFYTRPYTRKCTKMCMHTHEPERAACERAQCSEWNTDLSNTHLQGSVEGGRLPCGSARAS